MKTYSCSIFYSEFKVKVRVELKVYLHTLASLSTTPRLIYIPRVSIMPSLYKTYGLTKVIFLCNKNLYSLLHCLLGIPFTERENSLIKFLMAKPDILNSSTWTYMVE